jgi:hypothetical protein
MIKFRMKQGSPSIDDAELIQLVKNYEFLYNIKHADYRNLPMRAAVWATIAEKLNVEDREYRKF